MAVSQFQDLSWGPDEPLDMDKLNAMVGNERYLAAHMPKLSFSSYGGITKDAGVKIACGVVTVPPKKEHTQSVTVNFGSFFTEGCKPIIATGIMSYGNGRVHCIVHSHTNQNYVPDHRGFIAKVQTNELRDKWNYFWKTMYINWIAMGY
jgi:hypothetical protein